jgi:hypothetical protein
MKNLILLKKCLDHRLGWVDWRLVLFRLGVNGLGAVEAVIIPLLVTPSIYSSLESAKQACNLFPIFLLGSHLGYLRNKFSDPSECLLKNYINGSLIVSFVSALIIFLITNNFLMATVSIGVIAAATVEKELVTQNKILLASSLKPIISGFVIILASLNFFNNSNQSSKYILTVGWGVILWFFLVKNSINYSYKDLSCINWAGFLKYFEMIRIGFLSSMCTYIFGGHLMVDRKIVLKYYCNNISGYSLAFSFSQMCSAVVMAIAISYQFEIGSVIKTLNRFQYVKMRNRIVILGLLVVISLSPIVYVYSLIVEGYLGFFSTFLMLSSLNGLYFALSATSIVSIFCDLTGHLFLVYLIAFSFNIAISPVFGIDLNYYLYILKSSLILVFSALIVDRLIINRLPENGPGIE